MHAVADELHVAVALVLHERRGDIAGRGDDAVAGDLGRAAVLASADDGAVRRLRASFRGPEPS